MKELINNLDEIIIALQDVRDGLTKGNEDYKSPEETRKMLAASITAQAIGHLKAAVLQLDVLGKYEF